MQIRKIQSRDEFDRYDRWVKTHPEGNLWQSLERKQYVEALGKTAHIYVVEERETILGSALVVIDRTTLGVCTWEIPRGPIGEQREALLEQILEDAKKDRCMTLYFSPCKKVQSAECRVQDSHRLIHCEATRVLDLTQSEEALLAQMKPKGRYNIRVAEKHGIIVKQSDDIDAYYTLAKETGARDHYTIVSRQKYEAFLHHLPGSFLLLAYAPSPSPDPIAGLLGVLWNNQALYYYGASDYAHRALMAPYLLQWEAIRFAKAADCTAYDLLGISPPNAATTHPWDGISSFKEKFGGQILTYPAEQMIVLRPVIKMMLEMKRHIIRP